MKVLHVITGLGRGGAEASLVKLVGALPGVRHRIVSLLPEGPLADAARAAGAEVTSLDIRGSLPGPGAFLRLVREIRDFAPDVVQTWLYHADLLGLAASRLAGDVPVAWNIRCSDMDFSLYRRTTRLVVRLLALFSTAPEAIISNSRAAVSHHQNIGYARRAFTVIPNGFDLDRFRPDPVVRKEMRASWGMRDDEPVAGYVGRLDAMKDIPLLCAALAAAAARTSGLRGVFCGQGLGPNHAKIRGVLAAHGLEERVLLLGPREDVPEVMTAFDCLVLSSRSEGFPNVLGEAMACGLPCVTTDAGDAALIVGDTGRVVQRRDANSLGTAVAEIFGLPPEERGILGLLARERVEREFSIKAMGAAYLNLWESLRKDMPVRS